MSIELNKKILLAVEVFVALIILGAAVSGALSDISITRPGEGTEISGTQTIEVSVADYATQVKFYYRKSGDGEWNLLSTKTNDTAEDTSFSCEWDTSSVGDGTYSINATATDDSSTVSTINSNIEVDNINIPTPSNVMASDILDDQGEKLLVNWTWDGDADYLDYFEVEMSSPTLGTDWHFADNTEYMHYTSNTSFGINGLDNNETYCYHVKAFGTEETNYENSSWSSQACAEPNAEPLMDQVTIKPDNPTVEDQVQCVGFMHDIDDWSDLSVEYEIYETAYIGGSATYEGTTSCGLIGAQQWEDINIPGDATHECVVEINDVSSNFKKGNKYSCSMRPYDQKEYGPWMSTYDYTYINNSRPTAEDVKVLPSDANSSSTLTCNYTFSDINSMDYENESEAKFKWYKNRDGMNEWVRLEGQTGRTLKNTDEMKWFSRDDEIRCAVKVKDVDVTWPKLKNPYYDKKYRNSTVMTVQGNAEPGITDDGNDASTNETAAGIGENVTFSVEWIDEDDDEVRLRVCDKILEERKQYSDGGDITTFGNGSKVWYYSNRTGMLADTISIKPHGWSGVNNTTNHTYDMYVYEVSERGNTTPLTRLAKMNDIALSIDEWNTLKPEFSAGSYPDKYLGFKVCVDDENDGVCDESGEEVYVYANETEPGIYGYKSVEANVSNKSDRKTYWDPQIKINYGSFSKCRGNIYCNTSYMSGDPTDMGRNVTCSYNTSGLTKGNYSYELRVYDDGGAYSELRENMFFVKNRRPNATDVEVLPTEPNKSSTLECNYTFKDPDFGHTENESAAKFKWYKNRDGENDWILLEGETGETLQNTENNSWFSRDDKIMCAVSVEDSVGKNSSEFTNSSPVTVHGNANPELGDYWSDANFTEKAGIGENVTFSAEWMDEDDSEVRLTVCTEFMDSKEEQGSSSKDNISFGNDKDVWFYTNRTGRLVESVSVKPYNWTGKGSVTPHNYDIYAYEIENHETSPTSDPVAVVNDFALRMGVYNKFKLEFDAWPPSDKRIGLKFCVDEDNDQICDGGGEEVYFRANRTNGTYRTKEINSTGGINTYYDPQIKINYEPLKDNCKGEIYCDTNLTSDSPISCVHNTSSMSAGNYSYELRVYDPKNASSEVLSNTFYVKNRRPYAEEVEIEPSSPNASSALYCNYTFKDPDFGHTENESAAKFKWYKNRGGANDWTVLEEETGRTLENTENKTWFSSQDEIKCSVKVSDEAGKHDDEFVESPPTTIEDNHPPTLIKYLTDTNSTNPATMGNNINFSLDWLDEDSEDFHVSICEEVAVQEEQFDRGDSHLQFGGEPAWFYSNKTGQWVRRIYIAVDKFVNTTGNIVNESGRSTQHIYDLYVYNEEKANETDTSDLITQVNDISFTNEMYKEISLDNAQAMEGDVLGFKICIDSNNDGTCDGGMDRRAYVRANSTATGDYLARNALGSNLYDPQIKINYQPGGECFGKIYCVDNVTSAQDHGNFSCSYETTQDESWENGYEVRVCDEGGLCSQIRSGSFFVNRRPVIDWVNLTPDYPRENRSLSCNFEAQDPDTGQNITNTTYWYWKNHSSSWMFYGPAEEIKISRTKPGESWKCEPAITDDYGLTTLMNSSSVTVGEQEVTTTIPAIRYVISNKNTTPVNVGEDLNFTIDWAVRDQDEEELLSLYICNSTDISSGGCSADPDQIFYQSSPTGEYFGDPFTVSYIAKDPDASNQTYRMKLCNSTSSECSDFYNGSFYVNHRPTAEEVKISPGAASKYSILDCNYTYSSEDINISDDENVSLAEFRWYKNGELVQEGNESVFGGSLSVGDDLKCSVKVGDARGLADDNFVNSSKITVEPVPEVPIMWDVPDLVNVSKVNLIGYVTTDDVSEIFAQSLDLNNDKIENTTSDLENTTLLGEALTIRDRLGPAAKGSGHIKINETGHEAFTAASYIKIANHERKYFRYYNVTGKSKILPESGSGADWYYRLNITPNLEKDVPEGAKVYAYNNSYPDNWFNLTLGLHEHNNTIKARALNPAANGGVFEKEIYYYVPPEIDVIHPRELNYSALQGKFGPGNEFLISVVDSPQGVEKLNFTIRNSTGSAVDSGELTSETTNYTYQWDAVGSDPGNYSIDVGVVDGFDRYTEYTRNFSLDRTPPSLEIDTKSEVNGSYFHDNFNITSRIEDYTNVSYSVVGTNVSDENISTGYGNEYNWTSLVNISSLEDGLYTLRYIAEDSVGNSKTKSLNFYVDKHAWFNTSDPVENLTWVEDRDYRDAFNLSKHFVNTAGINVSYRHEGPENISLNNYNNDSYNVSFFPEDNWNGVETIRFFADDKYGVEQGSNIITLNVTDDYCNPPDSGEWTLNETETALCDSPDQPLLSGISEMKVVNDTVLNASRLQIDFPIHFQDNSTGYLKDSDFDETVYIEDNSSVTVWNCTFDRVVVSGNSKFTTYNSTHTINRLYAVDTEVNLNDENIGTLIFQESSGNITNSKVDTAIFRLNGSGSVELRNGKSDGLIDTDSSSLNVSSTDINKTLISVGSESEINISDSLLTELNISGKIRLKNSSAETANIMGGSQLNGSSSHIESLVPMTSAGETAEIRGNLSIGSAEDVNEGKVIRHYPAIFKNTALEPVYNVTLNVPSHRVSGWYATVYQEFNSTKQKQYFEVEGINFLNLTLGENTPLTFTSRLIDSDLDDISMSNDTDDDTNEYGGDYINDTYDNITGPTWGHATSSVSRWMGGNIQEPLLRVGGSTDLTGRGGVLPVEIEDKDGLIANFTWNFTPENKLEVQRIEINTGTRNGNDWVTFSYTRGLGDIRFSYNDGMKDVTKTLYLPYADYVCVKDKEVKNISEVSVGCSAPDETYLPCPGSESGYNCTEYGSDKVAVSGLSNSAVIQMSNSPPTYSNPSPVDGATEIGTSPTLSVDVDDIDGDEIDVYFYDNTTGSPSLIGTKTGLGPGSTASTTWTSLDYNSSYRWFVKAGDDDSNTTSESWEFTTESSSNGGDHDNGGATGSPGGYTPPSGTPELSKSITEDRVIISGIKSEKDGKKELDISGWDGGIYRLDVYTAQNVSSGSLNITWSNVLNAPSPKQEGYNLQVYRNFDTESDFGGKIERVEIYFRIPRSWVSENGIEEVEMWKYGRRWSSLDTVLVSESSEYFNLKATSEDFSYFSVIGKYEVNETVTPPPQGGPVCGDGTCEGNETKKTCPEDCLEPPSDKEGRSGLILALLLGLVVIASASGLIYYAFREGIEVPGTKYKFSGRIGKSKEKKPEVELEEGLTVDSILSNPQVFEGRSVTIDGIVEPFTKVDNKILYNINDGTGTIRGISPSTDYEGRGTIEGRVKVENGEPYLEF